MIRIAVVIPVLGAFGLGREFAKDTHQGPAIAEAPLIPREEAACYLPLDVMFLQDTTGSFHDDLPNVVRQLPDMVSGILAQNPNSYFGVAEVKDKPYDPLGREDDICYRLNDKGGLTNDVARFKEAYAQMFASGGGDLPEAQYQALINVVLDPAVGWRPLANLGGDAASGEAGARLVILSTDAHPHDPKSCDKYDPREYPNCPRDLPPNSATISNPSDVSYECLYEDYPSAFQMKDVLNKNNVYLTILTPDDDSSVVRVWDWVNQSLMKQPEDFYQIISSDSSDILAGVLKAIAEVTQTACARTTPEPTSASSATSGSLRSTRPTSGASSTVTTTKTIGTSATPVPSSASWPSSSNGTAVPESTDSPSSASSTPVPPVDTTKTVSIATQLTASDQSASATGSVSETVSSQMETSEPFFSGTTIMPSIPDTTPETSTTIFLTYPTESATEVPTSKTQEPTFPTLPSIGTSTANVSVATKTDKQTSLSAQSSSAVTPTHSSSRFESSTDTASLSATKPPTTMTTMMTRVSEEYFTTPTMGMTTQSPPPACPPCVCHCKCCDCCGCGGMSSDVRPRHAADRCHSL